MLSFMLTSLLIELTPGPNMAWLVALALSRGRRVALMAVAGVATGLLLLGLLAAFGLGAVVAASPWLYQTLRAFGFLYLLYLAWDIWRGADAKSGDELGSFRDGVMTNLLNPKAGLFYIAVLPAFIDPVKGSVMGQTFAFVLAYVAVATAVHAAIVVFAASARSALAGETQMNAIRRLLALSLAMVAFWFLQKT